VSIIKKSEEQSCIEDLRCTACNRKHSSKEIHTICPNCGGVLFVEYDLETAKMVIGSKDNNHRSFNIWRFSEIMPVEEQQFRYSLGEGWTPILQLGKSVHDLRFENVILKDEGQNPTGTFKSRGLCAAVSKGAELGIESYVIPTAGNAGAALAAYSARAGATSHVFMPQDTPEYLKNEVKVFGGNLYLVDGLITDAASKAKSKSEINNWFDVSTLKEPYRVEGKKTMGIEILEQLNWKVPDVIVYPTGGGTGIVGMWKAFDELEILGMIGEERPRMVAVQSEGCAPIYKAFTEKKKKVEFWENATTIAPGLRVPSAIGDYLILEAIYESNGCATVVSDKEILEATNILAKTEGIMLAPEAAATFASLKHLLDIDFVERNDKIVIFGTGTGLIYPNLWDNISNN
jgi:threonine synthase